MNPRNDSMTITLSKDDFVTIFKACEDRRDKLDRLQQESNNEDERADAGNDLIEVNLILKGLKQKADSRWGEHGWTTSDEYL